VANDGFGQASNQDADLVRSTGYLMRTTAVYGNGKFGIMVLMCSSPATAWAETVHG
jgi:hypothetical protein